MTDRYDFIGCAKRMGAVLIGRTEPSVAVLHSVATEFARDLKDTTVGVALKLLYDSTAVEPVPGRFNRLLEALPEEMRVQ